MECKQCTENLTAFQDGELRTAEAEEVRRHLHECAFCAEELSDLRKASEFVESRIPDLNPKPETWNLVRARIIDSRRLASPWRLFSMSWRLATAALAIFIFAGAGYIQYRQHEKQNLDLFVDKYVRERETWIRIKTDLTKHDAGIEMENPYADNPFIEIKATPAENPFLLEER
jgi:anti-sigma factor RsiW